MLICIVLISIVKDKDPIVSLQKRARILHKQENMRDNVTGYTLFSAISGTIAATPDQEVADDEQR